MTVLATLNRWMLKAAQRAEVLGAVVVLAIVFIFIVPLPTWLVDILIALNICISCLLIVLALYLPGPLAFSSFPSILLLTTMFRLALSIATTRLILLEQDAGDIVEAFGNFVVGGNLAVAGEVTANAGSPSSVGLATHTTRGVTAGGSTSGAPTPGT